MRRTSLPVLGSHTDKGSQGRSAPSDGTLAVDLGVLSVHFDGGRCHVRCSFCYLGERDGTAQSGVPIDLLCESLELLPYQELAIALSEPIAPVLEPLSRLVAAVLAQVAVGVLSWPRNPAFTAGIVLLLTAVVLVRRVVSSIRVAEVAKS